MDKARPPGIKSNEEQPSRRDFLFGIAIASTFALPMLASPAGAAVSMLRTGLDPELIQTENEVILVGRGGKGGGRKGGGRGHGRGRGHGKGRGRGHGHRGHHRGHGHRGHHRGHGGRYWRGRWYGWGGPCWLRTPAGWVWICG